MVKQLKVTDEVHRDLKEMKIHPNQSYNEVIEIMIKEKKQAQIV